MISYIRGALEQVMDGAAVIDVGGVGFLVNIPPSAAGKLPARGNEIKLYTHLQMKEDGVSLHGFLTQEEVRLFTLLISVSGIGPKAASSVLSVLSAEQAILAIIANDEAALSKAPGIGRKTAQRIILELRDKLAAGNYADNGSLSKQGGLFVSSDEKNDALIALQSLGYSRSESVKAILEIPGDDLTAERIIKLALKKLR
jgi:Holliday junction DNA helicase RuvA